MRWRLMTRRRPIFTVGTVLDSTQPRDLFHAEHLSEDGLGAERGGAEISDFFRCSGDGEPHYSRLFHGFTL